MIGSYKTLLRQRDISFSLGRLSIDLPHPKKKFRTASLLKNEMNPIYVKLF